MEIWKDIPGFEDRYLVSTKGNVRSYPRISEGKYGSYFSYKGKAIKPCDVDHGYLRVCLMKNGKRNYKRINRLVAEAFIPNPYGKQEVNNKNGIKTDNRVENLEWCTRQENVIHAYVTGLNPSRRKLTDKQVEEIRSVYKPHSREFGTVALAKKYGVSHVTIRNAIYTGYKRRGEQMRNCPLCGAKVKAKYPDMNFLPGVKKWCFTHACHHDQNLEHTSFISVYGDTKQEVIDRWNGVQHEVKESESL